MFSQIFTTRCLGVVRSPEAKCTFRPSAICQRYLMDALQHVPPVSDYDFTHFGQLYNQLGRRMHTMVMTSLCRHMNSRRSRAIRTSIMSVFPHVEQECMFVLSQSRFYGLSRGLHTLPVDDQILCVTRTNGCRALAFHSWTIPPSSI
jgi:hypothetical protein